MKKLGKLTFKKVIIVSFITIIGIGIGTIITNYTKSLMSHKKNTQNILSEKEQIEALNWYIDKDREKLIEFIESQGYTLQNSAENLATYKNENEKIISYHYDDVNEVVSVFKGDNKGELNIKEILTLYENDLNN